MKTILALLPLLLLSACAQKPTTFTPIEPAQVIPVQPLAAAPALATVPPLQLSPPQVTQVGPNHFLHYFHRPELSRNEVRLIRLNHDAYGEQTDVLAEALREFKHGDMAQSPWQFSRYWSGSAGPHSFQLRATVYDIELHPAIEFFISQWRDYPLTEVDTERVKRSLKMRRHEQRFLGNDYRRWWNLLALGDGHPYLSLQTDAERLDELQSDDLQQIWQQHRNASAWHLLIASPTAPETLHEIFTRQLASLPVAVDKNRALPTLPPSMPLTLHVLDAPGTVQTQVTLGYVLPDTGPEMSLACAFLGEWLGGSFAGRLFADLRERRGLAYAVGGGCEQKPLVQMLRFGGSTRLENTGAFVHGLLDHLRLAKEQLISADELSLLQQQLLGEWRVGLDSVDGQLDVYGHVLQMQRSWPQFLAREQRLQALTPDDVQQLAQRVFAESPVIVMRGDADKILPDLRAKFPKAKIVVEQKVPE